MKQYEAVIETTIRITDIVNAETEDDLETKIQWRRNSNKYKVNEMYVERENTVISKTEQVFRYEKKVLSDEELIELARKCSTIDNCYDCVYYGKKNCVNEILTGLVDRFEKLRRDAE